MTVPLIYDFRSLSHKIPTILIWLISRISIRRLVFFVRKREAKVLGFKNATEREIRKLLFS